MGFLQRGFAFGNRRGFAVPLPLPELLVEEQLLYDAMVGLDGTNRTRSAQLSTVSNRKIAKLSFPVTKLGSPTGGITLTIRNVSDDSILNSKAWGDAVDVPVYPTVTWIEVAFDTLILINGVVRMCVEFAGGDGGNQVAAEIQGSDVKANESRCWYIPVSWYAIEEDAAYIYKYYQG